MSTSSVSVTAGPAAVENRAKAEAMRARLAERGIRHVINGQEVQNRIIRTDRPFSVEELQEVANYLNAEFGGIDGQPIEIVVLVSWRSLPSWR